MASLIIHNLDDDLQAVLGQQAALHHCSIEQEALLLLRQAVIQKQQTMGFAQRINQRFSELEADELPIPSRQKARTPPSLI